MARDARSLAERYRAHRVLFLLALELGCTPAEAEARLAARQARARWQHAVARLDAKRAGRPPPPEPHEEPNPENLWWMKD